MLNKLNFIKQAFITKFNYGGLFVATLFFCYSVLPSLMPRPWYLQALISGVCMAVGYGLGVAVYIVLKKLTKRTLSKKAWQKLWASLALGLPIALVTFAYLGAAWQCEVNQIVGMGACSKWIYFLSMALSLGVAHLLLILARLIKKAIWYITKKSNSGLPPRLKVFLSSVLVLALLHWFVANCLCGFFVAKMDQIYSKRNNMTPTGVVVTKSHFRSGGEGSLIKWQDLGYRGQEFIGKGPTTKNISDFWGTPAKDPIRVYAGLKSASSPKQRAALALAELKRTGAFNRKVLVLTNTTGTGWISHEAVDSVEYMFGGDTAIVAQQYSYLPSWLSFLVNKNDAAQASRELYAAVHTEWQKMPESSRPKLYVYGLSLGAYAAQSVYEGIEDLQKSVDGAIFAGTPNETSLWRKLTNARKPGTPQIKPVYASSEVRFAADSKDIADANWNDSRAKILYLQHASDPVVWFGAEIFMQRPDWLVESRGNDVSANTKWRGPITFLQMAIDQFLALKVPDGYGHVYESVMVDSWASVCKPSNWNNQKNLELKNILSAGKQS